VAVAGIRAAVAEIGGGGGRTGVEAENQRRLRRYQAWQRLGRRERLHRGVERGKQVGVYGLNMVGWASYLFLLFFLFLFPFSFLSMLLFGWFSYC
jgi:hypothetical protein